MEYFGYNLDSDAFVFGIMKCSIKIGYFKHDRGPCLIYANFWLLSCFLNIANKQRGILSSPCNTSVISGLFLSTSICFTSILNNPILKPGCSFLHRTLSSSIEARCLSCISIVMRHIYVVFVTFQTYHLMTSVACKDS